MSVPLLGMKVGVDDLSVFGSTALLVIAIWQFYCVRRENHVISVIAEQAQKYRSDAECVGYLYHGVAHYFVFTTRFFDDVMTRSKKRPGATLAVSILFFMPVWIPVLNVLSDIYTLAVPYGSSFTPAEATWNTLSIAEKWEASIRMVYAVILSMISLYYCVRCRELDRETRKNVEQMRHQVEREETRNQPAQDALTTYGKRLTRRFSCSSIWKLVKSPYYRQLGFRRRQLLKIYR
jgi:hypothetical protein